MYNMLLDNIRLKLQEFKQNQFVQGGKEFLYSNGIVAKFAFLILILILYLTILSLGSFILTRIFKRTANPILVDGMINAKQQMIIRQNPSMPGSKPIARSTNERDGVEFTWSVWIFVEDSNFATPDSKSKHIFHKGNDKFGINGQAVLINAPGLYLSPIIADASNGDTAQLFVILNTFETANERVDINNVPLNKWVNVIIRVTKQNQLDIFINGTMVNRHKLSSIPRQNYGDVFVTSNGGFFGNLASLRYFEYAISTSKIQSIFISGPNRATINAGEVNLKQNNNAYLSQRWFLSGNQS